LRRFQNDWATAELVKQYLSNRRKAEARKRKLQDTQIRRHVDDLDATNSKEDSEDENEGDNDNDE
jgi:hypothetical protein